MERSRWVAVRAREMAEKYLRYLAVGNRTVGSKLSRWRRWGRKGLCLEIGV
jgi:2-keto-3-deoxy-L-rhamnonate aldolase RhmA